MEGFFGLWPVLGLIFLSMVAGAIAAWRLRLLAPALGARAASGGSPATVEDLDERLSHVLAQLRDMQQDAPRLLPEAMASERTALEAQAASLMKNRDALLLGSNKTVAAFVAVPPGWLGYLQTHPAVRGALWGGFAVALAGVLVAVVMQAGGADAPAGEPAARHDTALSYPLVEPATNDDVQALLGKLRAEPRDVATMVRLGHILIANGMYEEAATLSNRALQFEADNKEALVHAAALDALRDPAAGLAALDRVLAKDPAFAEAWLFRGFVAMQTGERDLMRQSFEGYLARAEPGAEQEHVRAILQRLIAAPN